jgi:hypothetical protein
MLMEEAEIKTISRPAFLTPPSGNFSFSCSYIKLLKM